MKKIYHLPFTIYHFKRSESSAGFTLIELLIVIAIIGIMVGFIAANYVSVRQKARDSQRKSNLGQIQSALEMYRADNSSYPRDNNPSNGVLDDGELNISGTVYMKTIPRDPSGSSYFNNGNYFYGSDGLTYTLIACLENKSDSQGVPPSGGMSGCSSSWYYILQNP